MKNGFYSLTDLKVLLRFSNVFAELTEYNLAYDHRKMAINCYITSQNLLYLVKELISECNDTPVKTPDLTPEILEVLQIVTKR